MPNPFNKEGKVISIPADELLELMEKREVKAVEEEKTIFKKEKKEKNIERNPREYPVTANFHEKLEWLEKEFDWQTKNLTQKIKKEYPKEANSIIQELLKHTAPLKQRLPEIAKMDIPEGHIPFVVVIKNDVIGGEKAMPLIKLEDEKGYAAMSADEIKGFKPIEGVKIPNGKAYLAIDIETGKTTLGKTPDEAIKKIKSEDRSPLTLEEGVALITHHPEILKDNCVWAPGSRHGDDKVADLWLNEGEPKLYWNWANRSHAKWGSASCGSRVGP